MKHGDLRISELFGLIRRTVDLLEDIALRPPKEQPLHLQREQAKPIVNRLADEPERMAYSVKEACRLIGIGRSSFYTLVANSTLLTIKVGRRTLVPAKALRNLIEGTK